MEQNIISLTECEMPVIIWPLLTSLASSQVTLSRLALALSQTHWPFLYSLNKTFLFRDFTYIIPSAHDSLTLSFQPVQSSA